MWHTDYNQLEILIISAHYVHKAQSSTTMGQTEEVGEHQSVDCRSAQGWEGVCHGYRVFNPVLWVYSLSLGSHKKHTAKAIKEWLKKEDIEVMEWPSLQSSRPQAYRKSVQGAAALRCHTAYIELELEKRMLGEEHEKSQGFFIYTENI